MSSIVQYYSIWFLFSFKGTNNSSPPHSESELRALEAGRMNMPHPHQAGVPYYPSVPGKKKNLLIVDIG